MVNCFIDFLKCILCCEDDTCNDPYLDDHDNSYIRVRDQRNSYENFFSRRQERDCSSSSGFSSVYIHEHRLGGSNSTVSVPAKKALVSTSSNHWQVVKPSSASASASAVSSTSSNDKPKLYEPSQPRVVVYPPTASPKPPKESVSKPSYTPSPSVSSTKPPPVASSKSKSSSIASSSSFERHEGDLKSVKAVWRRVSSEGNKTTYAQEDTSPIYMIPKEIQDIIKRDEVPGILRGTITPLTYKDYFATLLNAEDFEIEKWSEFELKDVSLQLHEASVLKQNKDRNRDAKGVKDNRIFVTFEIDSVPERRPFFLSRDFVFAKPVGRQDKKFQGIIHRVQKSRRVLVEFEDRFYAQHNSRSRYDISFSFNRVSLKRAHQALEAALHPSFKHFLFPSHSYKRYYSPGSPSSPSFDKLGLDQQSAIRRILGLRGPPPYLVMGPPTLYLEPSQSMVSRKGPKTKKKMLSRAGVLVREAVLAIYRMVENCHILVSAPKNSTCDDLMSSLMEDIPESVMLRANAAFRDIDEVPDEIFNSCHYRKDCFTCPPLQKLKKFRVVFCTFVSGFRLHNEGIKVGHFSHIFLVDASSAIEPEVMITLANFANDDTSVIVTGSPLTGSRWVRSEIAWRNGLQKSYFQRLSENALYKSLNSAFIIQLQDPDQESQNNLQDVQLH